ncbi:MAG: hypothetical protein ACLRQF_06245 [Thomasclavelia ramosa]
MNAIAISPAVISTMGNLGMKQEYHYQRFSRIPAIITMAIVNQQLFQTQTRLVKICNYFEHL